MSRAAVWTWCGVGFAVLVLATAVATIGLLDVNRDAYQTWVNFDPQGNEQQYEDLRTSAAMMYTSAHAVGQLCAALFGVLLGATAARGASRWNLALAIGGGVGLAVINVAIAVPRARAAVPDHGMFGELTSHGFAFDPNFLNDSGVVAFLVAGLIAFPLWTLLGLGAGRRWRPVVALIVLLAWFPVSMVGGFASGGVGSGVLPLYSNLGLAQLTLSFPWVSAVVTLVLTVWAVWFYRIGTAARHRPAQTTSAPDIQPR